MKKLLFLSFIALISIGCDSSAQTIVETNSSNVTAVKKEDTQTVAAHTTETQSPVSSRTNTNSSDNSKGNSPMSKAIDVSEMTANIEKAEKEYKAKPKDAKAKENLATAYFERAFALTEAAQYRAAIGDFRKGLKLNPDNKEAKDMYDQTILIFKSLGREPPKEGEEPAPLPIDKK
jgi:tetratricopeptide (TPR) repeat protein